MFYYCQFLTFLSFGFQCFLIIFHMICVQLLLSICRVILVIYNFYFIFLNAIILTIFLFKTCDIIFCLRHNILPVVM